jgi:Arm DNA-binding domain
MKAGTRRGGRGRRTAEKLTSRVVATARHSGSSYSDKAGSVLYRQEILWDLEVPGLGLRLLPSGRKSWVLHFRVQFRTRLAVLGSAGVLTLDQARRLARGKLVDLDRTGRDPLPRQKRGEALAECTPLFLDSCRARGVKASTLAKYREAAKLIAEDLGHFAVNMIDHLAVRRAFARWTIQRGPYSANRALQVVRALLQFASQTGWRDFDTPNPADGIKKHKENRRGREITTEEMGRIGAALDGEESGRPEARDTVVAIRLLLLTGARRREITGLTWSEVANPACSSPQ